MEISISEKSFSIRNSGIDYPLKSDIFERFSRHTLHEQSTGLGLAIVKSIVNSYQLPIQYSFEESHVFKITFWKNNSNLSKIPNCFQIQIATLYKNLKQSIMKTKINLGVSYLPDYFLALRRMPKNDNYCCRTSCKSTDFFEETFCQ